jgi:hypothetical protein
MSAIVFDRDEVDHLKALSEPRRLSASKLLWVDLHEGSEFSADDVAKAFDLEDATRQCLASPNERACFDDYGRYFHITTYAPREDDEGQLHVLEWVLGSYTAAFERIEQRLEEFDVHAMRGEGADEDIELLIEMRREVGKLAARARRLPLRTCRLDPPGTRGARRKGVGGALPVTLKVGLFATAWLFWVVVAAIVALAPATLSIAKLRHWI